MSDGSRFGSARYALDDAVPVVLHTLTGESVVVLVHAIDVEQDRVEVHLTMTVDMWGRAMADGAFHSDLEAEELRPDGTRPIEVVLVLRAPIVAGYDTIDPLLADLLGDRPSPLQQTEAWLLVSALQEVAVPGEPEARASVGIRTGWARPFT